MWFCTAETFYFIMIFCQLGACLPRGMMQKLVSWTHEGRRRSLNFFFFLCEIGGPGSGKVSHSQRLSQDSQGQILHLNVIDLLKSTFGLTSKMKWIMYYDTAWYSLCWRRRRHHNAQERKHSITRNRESHFWYSESC